MTREAISTISIIKQINNLANAVIAHDAQIILRYAKNGLMRHNYKLIRTYLESEYLKRQITPVPLLILLFTVFICSSHNQFSDMTTPKNLVEFTLLILTLSIFMSKSL